jgi:hypothetical protein
MTAFAGQVAELVMFSDALGADDRGAVQRYFSRKWGLDASVAARSVMQRGTD